MNMANMPPSIMSTLVHCGLHVLWTFRIRSKEKAPRVRKLMATNPASYTVEEVNANLVRKPGARIWPKVWVFSSVVSRDGFVQ